MRSLFIMLIVSLISFTACSDDKNNSNPIEPPPNNQSALSGTWNDSTSVNENNTTRKFSLTLMLTESNGSISGNFSAEHVTTNNSGSILREGSSGTITGGTLVGKVVTILCSDFVSISGEIDDSNSNEIKSIATVSIPRIDSTYTYIYELTLEKK